MALHGNKAIMGIGTLIIFIATILVAAVAAAVIISTSNVLQQRSLLVGQEARKAITNSIEVISILTASDASDETFNNFEILVRLSPGSDPIQMRKFNIEYISTTFDQSADLTFSDNETTIQVGEIRNGSNTTVYDLDGDGINDSVTLRVDALGSFEGLQFYLTGEGNWSDNLSLGIDISNASSTNVTVNLGESPIVYNQTHYGYISVEGVANTDNALNASMNITLSQVPDTCSFSLLSPEDRYCFQVMNGNNDFVLNSGERFKLLYKLKTQNELTIGEDFQFIFISEERKAI